MLSRLTLRPRFATATLALALAGFAFLLAGHATKAPADFNDNTNCWGHIKKGTPDPNDPASIPVAYQFQCDGQITGYSILTAPERQVQGVDTEVFVNDGNGNVVGTDSFSCNGEFPGYGINCDAPAGAKYQTPGNFIPGQFYVDRNACAEPRLDPILYVAYAETNSKGQVKQSMAGPFDLGQPTDCPPIAHWKTHTHRKMPASNDTVLTGQEDTAPAKK